MAEKFEFVLYKDKWLRGEKEGKLLRGADGLMCCVGQLLEQLGVPEAELRGRAAASELSAQDLPEAVAWLVEDGEDGRCFSDSDDAAQLHRANDRETYSDELRVKFIEGVLMRHGITMKVV